MTRCGVGYGVHARRALAGGGQAGKAPGLFAACGLRDQEPAFQPGDQILHRATLAFGGADHAANAPGLSLLTAPLVALERRAVGGQVGVELLALGQQHLPEMFGLKAIRGFGRLVACVHIAR